MRKIIVLMVIIVIVIFCSFITLGYKEHPESHDIIFENQQKPVQPLSENSNDIQVFEADINNIIISDGV